MPAACSLQPAVCSLTSKHAKRASLTSLVLVWPHLQTRTCPLPCIRPCPVSAVGIYWFERRKGTSYESHLFGAAAGVCIALVLGRNVHLERSEVLIIWLGAGGYATLSILGFVYQQYAASGLAALLLPFLVWRALERTKTALLKREATRSQRPPPGLSRNRVQSWQKTRMVLMKHGTHVMLLGLMQRAKLSSFAAGRSSARSTNNSRGVDAALSDAAQNRTEGMTEGRGGRRAQFGWPRPAKGVRAGARAPPRRLAGAHPNPTPLQTRPYPGRVKFASDVDHVVV